MKGELRVVVAFELDEDPDAEEVEVDVVLLVGEGGVEVVECVGGIVETEEGDGDEVAGLDGVGGGEQRGCVGGGEEIGGCE